MTRRKSFISDDEMAKIDEVTGPKTTFLSDDDMEKLEKDQKLWGVVPKTTAKAWLNALPTAGGLLGGAVGTGAGAVAIPGVGALPGAAMGLGLGAAGGKAAQNFLESALDLGDEPMTRAKLYGSPVKEGMLAMIADGIGNKIGAIGKADPYKVSPTDLAKVNALAKDGQAAADAIKVKELPNLLDINSEMFRSVPKENADEIAEAAARLGAKPTPGMLTANKNVQNLEQVLSERPTIAGEIVRRRSEPLSRAVKEASEEVGQTTAFTPYEYGNEAKKGLMGKIAERLDPLTASYDDIAESTSKAVIDPKQAERTAKGLINTTLAKGEGLPANVLANKYAQMLSKAEDAETVRNIISAAGKEARDLSGTPEGIMAGKVKQAGERLLRRGLIKAGEEGAGEEGVSAAKELISQLRDTNKGYRQLTGDINDSLGHLNLGTNSPGAVARTIDKDLPAEKLVQKLFDAKNVGALQKVQEFSPEAFEAARQNRLNEIVQKSLTKGQVDPSKLARNIGGLPREVKELLVGKENVSKLTDVKTLMDALPEIVGPSRTPRGLAWGNYLRPGQWYDELSDALKLRALSTGKAPSPVQLMQKGAGLLQSPALPPAAIVGSGLIRSEMRK